MTAKTLEEEARGAAIEHACSLLRMGLRPTAATERGDHYELGFLAAATLRDKEIEELRARVKVLEGMVPKWVQIEDVRSARSLGWELRNTVPVDGPDGRCWMLMLPMVPPIPLPGEDG